MKFIADALVACGTLAALGAHAEGLYVGGGLGSSRFNGADVGGASTDRNSTAYKLYGGCAFTPNLGLEAGGVDLGKFSSSADQIKANGLYLDAVGTLPLGNNVSVLGRLGVFNGELKSSVAGSDRGTNIKLGAGLQYDLAGNVGVRGEWERYRFDALGIRPNVDLFSIGVNYRF